MDLVKAMLLRFRAIGIYLCGSKEWIVLLLLATIVCIIWGKQYRRIAVWVVAAICLVRNPFTDWLLTKILGDTYRDISYRLSWIVPVSIIFALIICKALEESEEKYRKVIGIVLGVCLLLGTQWLSLNTDASTYNIWRINKEWIEVVEEIHKDSQKEECVVMGPYDFWISVRQYDASIQLPFSSQLAHTVGTGASTWENLMETEEEEKIVLLQMVMNDSILEEESIEKALEKHRNIEYFVMNKNYASNAVLENLGYVAIYESEGYLVYKNRR